MFSAVCGVVLALVAPLAPGAAAEPTPPPASVRPTEVCQVRDPRVAELSGLASDGSNWYAVPDGGSQIQIFVLARDCAVRRVITAPVDPYDVEDMARAADGTFWLADTGDNRRQRETVALHAVSPNGRAVLHRLTYPDGPHDAEALLLDRAGVPHLVTKEPLGGSAVYRPAGPLAAPGPTALEKVATVRLGPTDTKGGPVAGFGSVLVTGGAVSADGTVVALRTYTDAYLFSAPDGDVVAALGREPVRVPLPDEPQGEALAFEPDGTLLAGGEFGDRGSSAPMRAIPGATRLVAPSTPSASAAGKTPQRDAAPDAASADASASDDGSGTPWTLKTLGIAGVAVALVVVVLGRRRRSR
ncbi:hypothetical protein LX15_000471 [Streptoalloteichus tenebrarius]|uniref:Esterase-like activity of phytase family protein n=1 Tax=Streptoalloteichus tenebrarius (strain ATCC 17920 / DSM 40477 / JCM 4838 / CBS 697.72 / NBRC 16177 / NCIMB 11028 / NRRL B-12390 / A12253. 1 / ISP 5477) TaxID=1933 RepID=A0ABT1HMQ3_STRSD|nr:hypothetical protein [Streptoalloteichus tenebrarius]BFF00307.1 hypothetical protein GCM10020241_19820 [Streptoalloteichus tenebrarius]